MTVVGITECPECAHNLSSTDSNSERPVQVVLQSCTSCSFIAHIGLVWYHDGTYDLVGPVKGVSTAKKESCVECDSESTAVVIENVAHTSEYYCDDCLRAHHETTLNRAASGI